MRRSHFVAAAISILALAAGPASANHWWGGYRWAILAAPLDVRVNAALTGSGNWTEYVNRAVTQDWEASDVLTLGTVHPSSTSPKKCSPIAKQILVCNEAYGLRGWLGIAAIWTDNNGRINQATTKLNDSYFSLSTYNTPAWKNLVSCQEIGHDFGLAHQDENFNNVNLGSCMDYTNAPSGGTVNGFNYGPSNEYPNQHDYDELDIIYTGRADGYTTATSSTAAAPTNFGVRDLRKPQPAPAQPGAGSGDSPAEWGAAVHHDGNGRPDLFARPLANGGTMLTHVFWAPDTRAEDIH